MAVINCRKYVNKISTKAGVCQKCGVPIEEARKAFKIMGGMLALLFVSATQFCYGSQHSDTSHTATAVQASSAESSAKATKSPSAVGLSSLTSGSDEASKIVWEPIGKYSQQEINLVSDTVGELFAHMKKMEAIESSVAPLVRGGDKAADKSAKLRTARNYSVEAQEESKKIDQFEIPALKNQQAAEMLVKAKAALKNASEIQKERASKLIKMVSGNGHSKALSDEIQELGARRISAAFQFLSAYMAYESYGYTSDQIDLTTGRLMKNAKPDRLEADSQTARKNTP